MSSVKRLPCALPSVALALMVACGSDLGNGPPATAVEAVIHNPGGGYTAEPPPPPLDLTYAARWSQLTSSGVPTSFSLWQSIRVGRALFFTRAAASLHLTSADTLVEVSVRPSNRGYVHSRFQQQTHGIPVEGATYAITERDGSVVSGSGHLAPGIQINPSPAISESSALATALGQIGATQYRWQSDPNSSSPPVGTLVVYSKDFGASAPFKLAWRFLINTTLPTWTGYVSYVDAQDGQVIESRSSARRSDTPASGTTQEGHAVSFTSDQLFPTRFRLGEKATRYIRTRQIPLHGTATVDFFDVDNQWNEPAVRPGVSAHWAGEKIWDFLVNRVGLSGVDGLGPGSGSQGLFTTQRALGECPKPTSYWEPGDETVYLCATSTGPDVSLDTVAHEFGHALKFYAGKRAFPPEKPEAYAVDESVADVFAVAVQNWGGSGPVNWMVAGRNVAYPKSTQQPDTYKGVLWQGTEEHVLDGVGNRFFYLLAMGGSGTNDLSYAYDVHGVGLERAEDIVFDTVLDHLDPLSGYAEYRASSLQTAVELFGDDSPEEAAVAAAWDAVGVTDPSSAPSKQWRSPAFKETAVDPWPTPLSFETGLSTCSGGCQDQEVDWAVEISEDATFNTLVQKPPVTEVSVVSGRVSAIAKIDLRPKTVYFWRVKTRRAANGWDANWGWTSSFETGWKAPTNVTPVHAASDIYPWPATFTWSPVDGATSYEVQVGTVANMEGSTTVSDYPPIPKSEGLNLIMDRQHFWRVRARGPTGPGGWSSSVHSKGAGVVTKDDLERDWTPAQALTFTTSVPKVTFTSPAKGATAYPWPVKFAWKEVRGAEFYEFELSRADDSSFSPLLDLQLPRAGETSAESDITPELGKKYYWKVRAFGPSNQATPWSNGDVPTKQWFQVDSATAPTLIHPVDDITVPANNLKFDWQAVTGATSYKVTLLEVVSGVGSKPVTSFPVPKPLTAYTFAGPLKYPARYAWTVQAMGPGDQPGIEAPPSVFNTEAPSSGSTVPCNATVIAGGNVKDDRGFELGKTSGTLRIHYKTYDIQDDITVFYNGVKLWTSGCVATPLPNQDDHDGAPWKTATIPYGGTSTQIRVLVNPNCNLNNMDPGTLWTYQIDCP